jgi:hypothetical protein
VLRKQHSRGYIDNEVWHGFVGGKMVTSTLYIPCGM